MKEKYVKLESVLTALYLNKRIGNNGDGDIDPKAITDILALPTEEIEPIEVNQNSNIPSNYNYDSWNEMLNKLLTKQDLYDIKWTLLNESPYIPKYCKVCPNHPSNGGSGICLCTLGTQVTY